jgi:hypothetical protein
MDPDQSYRWGQNFPQGPYPASIPCSIRTRLFEVLSQAGQGNSHLPFPLLYTRIWIIPMSLLGYETLLALATRGLHPERIMNRNMMVQISYIKDH